MEWVFTHWTEILVGALALSGAFAQIAQVTPWLWDDEASGIIAKILAALAGNLGSSKGI